MKKILSLILALTLAASLFACGGKSPTAPVPPATHPPAVSPTPAPGETIPDYITIQGRQYSTSATSLDLNRDGLTNADIEPLRNMTNLTYLSLVDN
ncbi:MAG: hypothetical protein LBS90_00415, partial [Oscillospiraceae bacterium]|nr:hypothetical protein [Oscillospiraceae bacterium]